MRTVAKTAGLTGLVACILLSASILPAPDPPIELSYVALEFEDVLLGFLERVTSVGSRTEIIEQKIVGPGGQEIIRKIPGSTRFLDIVGERGITSSLTLSEWRGAVENGQIESARGNITLIVYNAQAEITAVWQGSACWPSAIDNLLPDDGGVPLEVIEIACETVVREQ